jgi:hypothetical protein
MMSFTVIEHGLQSSGPDLINRAHIPKARRPVQSVGT